METNTNWLKITGKVEIKKPLALDQDLEMTVKGSIVKKDQLSNQDGTKDDVYILKLIESND